MNIDRIPILRGINRKLTIIAESLKLYIPPGHFYSPIVSQKEVRNDQERIFKKNNELSGIDLNIDYQLFLLDEFKGFYNEFISQYNTVKALNLRYTPENGFYGYTDGIFLYSMIRYFQPDKIIEVGSGYSSALMADTVNLFLNNKTNLFFIEPYPENRLLKLFPSRRDNVNINKSKVQNIPLQIFSELGKNDILFVDSSHVSKTGSDVNYILFDVLPLLKSGVIVHFHDVFYPFEYPVSHVLGNRWYSWNEAYILHAFLINNTEWEIIFWNSCIEHLHVDKLKKNFSAYFKGGSSSVWIRKK